MNKTSSCYVVGPITANAVDRAYTLMRAVAPSLSLTEWREFCEKFVSPSANQTTDGAPEQVVIASNAQEYIHGLCVYSIREHWLYGRLVDVPIFVIASAADAEGVGVDLVRFLQAAAARYLCAGMRFWTLGADIWARRLNEEDIRRSDHGIFLPAIESVAQIENVLSTCALASPGIIERLSR